MVGLIGGFALVPLVVFGLYGGAIADVVDRRLLMLWTADRARRCCPRCWSRRRLAGLESVWLLYLVVALQSALFAVNNPARASAIPRLIGVELLPAANALQQVTWNLGFTLGPLLGGVLIATLGLGAAYGARPAVVHRRAVRRAAAAADPAGGRQRPRGPGWRRCSRGCGSCAGKTRRADDVPGRHRRDGVRHAAGAVPRGRRASSTAVARAWPARWPRRRRSGR